MIAEAEFNKYRMRQWITLIESLKSPAPWSWDDMSHDHAGASFRAGTAAYAVGFSGAENVSVTFWNEDTADEGRDGIGIVGSGNAFAVFATLLDIIETFLHERQPDKLYFTARASEPSRIKLYDRLSRLIDVPGYRFERSNTKAVIYRFIKEIPKP